MFKTPTLSAARRSARRRTSQFSGLLAPWREDVTFRRGSTSDKRRKSKGKNAFDLASFFDIDIVPDNPLSPVHAELR